MTNYLHRIADGLIRAADDLDRHAEKPVGKQIHYVLWAKHFREDAKTIRLLAEVFPGEAAGE